MSSKRVIYEFDTKPNGRTCWVFLCPACGIDHPVHTGPGTPSNELTNKDKVNPTFRDPIDHRWGYDGKGPANCCCSTIAQGKITYSSDCTHDKAGKTLPLSPYPEA